MTVQQAVDVLSDGPGKTAKIVMWRNGEASEFECRWGLSAFRSG